MPKSPTGIVYCADAIVVSVETDKIVLIERLSGAVQGLALPGGKCDSGETLHSAVIREVKEETGLVYTPHGVLMTCAEEGRDPRGRYVSTVFYGAGWGTLRSEAGKTRVLELTPAECATQRDAFVLDHYRMLETYLRLKVEW